MNKQIKIIDKVQCQSKELNFWKNKSPEEKLSTLQILREQYIYYFNKQDEYAESRKGLLPEGTPSEEEFIELLNKHKAEYMVVGAYAFALYAIPRNTGDIDIFINRTSKKC